MERGGKHLLRKRDFVCALLTLALSAISVGCSGNAASGAASSSTGTITPAVVEPCDLYAAATPCVAAYSTTRALYSTYDRFIYQVTRQSDGLTSNIGLLPNKYANTAAQDSFCTNTTCTITKIYDQSPNHNDLTLAPPGGADNGAGPNGYDLPAIANALPITVGGQKAYGIAISPGMGYRNDAAIGVATNGKPEGVYMVTSTIAYNGACCFDFGNAETNNKDNGAAHMDAISIYCPPGASPCTSDVGLDMENGIYGGLAVPLATPFVTDMGANDGQKTYTIWWGNSQSPGLTTTGSLSLPSGYLPMLQEGAIILGIGGDNSNRDTGYFFEGVMTQGAPTDAVMNSVQSNIVAAGYSGL